MSARLLSLAGEALPSIGAIGAGWLGSLLAPDKSQAAAGQAEGQQPDTGFDPLAMIKNHAINPFNAITGTMSVLAQQNGKHNSPIHTVAKLGSWAGDALNWHTVFSAANDDSLSGMQKASTISSTLGGMYAGKAADKLLTGSKDKRLQALAPAAGYLANDLVNKGVAAAFGLTSPDGTDKGDNPAKLGQPLELPIAPEALNSSSSTVAAAPNVGSVATGAASQVTVNANITVNASPTASAQDIAIQIKQVLEQQQQRAQRDVQARYYNAVA